MGVLGKAWNFIKSIGIKVWNNIKSVASKFWKSLKDSWKLIKGEKLADATAKTGSTLSKVGKGLKEGVGAKGVVSAGKTAAAVAKPATGIFGKIANYFKNAATKAPKSPYFKYGQMGLIKGLPRFFLQLAADVTSSLGKMILKEYVKDKLEEAGLSRSVAEIAANEFMMTIGNSFIDGVVLSLFASPFGFTVTEEGGFADKGQAEKAQARDNAGGQGTAKEYTVYVLDENGKVIEEKTMMLTVKDLSEAQAAFVEGEDRAIPMSKFKEGQAGHEASLEGLVIVRGEGKEKALLLVDTRQVKGEVLAQIQGYKAAEQAAQGVYLWRDVNGNPISQSLPIINGLQAVRNQGLGRIVGGALKVLALHLLRFTNMGGDVEKAWKLALSQLIGGVASSAVDNLNTVAEWYAGNPEEGNPFGTRQEGESYKESLIKTAGREIASGTDRVVWAAIADHYNLDGAAGELAHVAFTSVASGAIDAAFRRDPGKAEETVYILTEDGQKTELQSPAIAEQHAGDVGVQVDREDGKSYLVIYPDRENLATKGEFVEQTTEVDKDGTPRLVDGQSLTLEQLKQATGNNFQIIFDGNVKEFFAVCKDCQNDSPVYRLKPTAEYQLAEKMTSVAVHIKDPHYTNSQLKFNVESAKRVGAAVVEDINNNINLAAFRAASTDPDVPSGSRGNTVIDAIHGKRDEFVNIIQAGAQGANPSQVLGNIGASYLASQANQNFTQSMASAITNPLLPDDQRSYASFRPTYEYTDTQIKRIEQEKEHLVELVKQEEKKGTLGELDGLIKERDDLLRTVSSGTDTNIGFLRYRFTRLSAEETQLQENRQTILKGRSESVLSEEEQNKLQIVTRRLNEVQGQQVQVGQELAQANYEGQVMIDAGTVQALAKLDNDIYAQAETLDPIFQQKLVAVSGQNAMGGTQDQMVQAIAVNLPKTVAAIQSEAAALGRQVEDWQAMSQAYGLKNVPLVGALAAAGTAQGRFGSVSSADFVTGGIEDYTVKRTVHESAPISPVVRDAMTAFIEDNTQSAMATQKIKDTIAGLDREEATLKVMAERAAIREDEALRGQIISGQEPRFAETETAEIIPGRTIPQTTLAQITERLAQIDSEKQALQAELVAQKPFTPEFAATAKIALTEGQPQQIVSSYSPSISGIAQAVETYGNEHIADLKMSQTSLAGQLEHYIQNGGLVIDNSSFSPGMIKGYEEYLAKMKDIDKSEKPEEERAADAAQLRVDLRATLTATLTPEEVDRVLQVGDSAYGVAMLREQSPHMEKFSWLPGESQEKKTEVQTVLRELKEGRTVFNQEYTLLNRTERDQWGRPIQTAYYGHQLNSAGQLEQGKLDRTTDYHYNAFGVALVEDVDYTQAALPKPEDMKTETQTVTLEAAKPEKIEVIPGTGREAQDAVFETRVVPEKTVMEERQVPRLRINSEALGPLVTTAASDQLGAIGEQRIPKPRNNEEKRQLLVSLGAQGAERGAKSGTVVDDKGLMIGEWRESGNEIIINSKMPSRTYGPNGEITEHFAGKDVVHRPSTVATEASTRPPVEFVYETVQEPRVIPEHTISVEVQKAVQAKDPETRTIPAQDAKTAEVITSEPRYTAGPNITSDMNLYSTGKGHSPWAGPSNRVVYREINSGPMRDYRAHYALAPHPVYSQFEMAVTQLADPQQQQQGAATLRSLGYSDADIEEGRGKLLQDYSKRQDMFRALSDLHRQNPQLKLEDLMAIPELSDKVSDFIQGPQGDVTVEQRDQRKERLMRDFAEVLAVSDNTQVRDAQPQVAAATTNNIMLLQAAQDAFDTTGLQARHEDTQRLLESDLSQVQEVQFYKNEQMPGDRGKTYSMPTWSAKTGYNYDDTARFDRVEGFTYDKGTVTSMVDSAKKKAEDKGNAQYGDFLDHVGVYNVEGTDIHLVTEGPVDTDLDAAYQYKTKIYAPQAGEIKPLQGIGAQPLIPFSDRIKGQVKVTPVDPGTFSVPESPDVETGSNLQDNIKPVSSIPVENIKSAISGVTPITPIAQPQSSQLSPSVTGGAETESQVKRYKELTDQEKEVFKGLKLQPDDLVISSPIEVTAQRPNSEPLSEDSIKPISSIKTIPIAPIEQSKTETSQKTSTVKRELDQWGKKVETALSGATNPLFSIPGSDDKYIEVAVDSARTDTTKVCDGAVCETDQGPIAVFDVRSQYSGPGGKQEGYLKAGGWSEPGDDKRHVAVNLTGVEDYVDEEVMPYLKTGELPKAVLAYSELVEDKKSFLERANLAYQLIAKEYAGLSRDAIVERQAGYIKTHEVDHKVRDLAGEQNLEDLADFRAIYESKSPKAALAHFLVEGMETGRENGGKARLDLVEAVGNYLGHPFVMSNMNELDVWLKDRGLSDQIIISNMSEFNGWLKESGLLNMSNSELSNMAKAVYEQVRLERADKWAQKK
ncbi:MAG: hypothetical protein WC723_06760 [Candidatus Omnitrophota bacterium]